MKQEKSCGAVVFHRAGAQIEYLLLRHRNGDHWGFPKGHVEDGESEVATALREIYEETGLRVRLLEGFRRTVEYAPEENSWKQVVYFIGEARERQCACQWEEVSECRWVGFEAGMQLLSHENNRGILQAAQRFLTFYFH
ncbi:MAG: NUDIX domain-containing protein [Bacillota bacterium]|jgi:8-oxo-dGTP pyrophosphatase MutT (NUDIX family)